jgi:hypothetical protein
MKITKQELVKVIKEELEAVMGEDQEAFLGGGKAPGREKISVEKIRISPDGSFKAALKSATLKEPLKVAGNLDHNSTALLQQKGAIAKPAAPKEEPPKELTPAAKEMMQYVDTIKSNYEGGEAGMPPSLAEVEKLVRSSDFEGLKKRITTLWNDLLKWHQKSGSKLNYKVASLFNQLNTLTRKQTG